MGRKRKNEDKGNSTALVIILAVLYIIGFALSKIDFGSSSKSNDNKNNNAIEMMDWPTPLRSGETNDVAEILTKKNYYVILDGSGSMAENKCSGSVTKEVVAKDAIVDFSKKVSAEDNLGLLIFDSTGTSERTPLGTNNRDQFIEALHNSKADGNTPLRSAIRKGVSNLGVQARRQLGYGEYHLIIVTDGEASENEEPNKVVNFVLGHTPIIIHTIGFCIGNKHSLNQQGKTFYRAADDKQSLTEGLGNVLAESEEFDISDFQGL